MWNSMKFIVSMWLLGMLNESVGLPMCIVNDLDADYIIGGLFTLHVKMPMVYCNSVTNTIGYTIVEPAENEQQSTMGSNQLICVKHNTVAMLWVEAMLTAIDEINRSNDILPGIDIGYYICDTLSSPFTTTIHSLDMLLHDNQHSEGWYHTITNDTTNIKLKKPVMAVIGASLSSNSAVANNVFSSVSIPQVSYSSTNPHLSSKDRYPSFLRTIPSDTYQATAFADISLHFNWTYVGVIASSDDYGYKGVEALETALSKLDICIAVKQTINPDATVESGVKDAERAITALKSYQKSVHVVITFINSELATVVLKEAVRQNLTGITWIASEAWSDHRLPVYVDVSFTLGRLALKPVAGNLTQFEAMAKSKTPQKTARNPWFKEFLDNQCQQSNKNDTTHCYSKATKFLKFNKCGQVFDAVYSVAMGAHNTLRDTEDEEMIEPKNLLHHIQNVNFTSPRGTHIEFDQNGDPIGSYILSNLKFKPGGVATEFEDVGFWDGSTHTLHIYKDVEIVWNGNQKQVPRSECSSPCQPGTHRIAGSSKCCFKCVECAQRDYQPDSNQETCRKCPDNMHPNADNTDCVKASESYLKTSESLAAQIVLISALVLFLIVMTTFVLFKYQRDTPWIKASNYILSQLMLIAMAITCLLPMLYIGKPSRDVCYGRVIAPTCAVTICSAVLLVRSVRIVYLFNRKLTSRGSFMSGNLTQLLTVSSFLIIPIFIIAIVFIYKDTPDVNVINTYYNNTMVMYIACNDVTNFGHEFTCVYMIFITGCWCVAVYNTRHVPHIFNETKWMGLTMFTLWMLWLPLLLVSYSRSELVPITCSWTMVLSVLIYWVYIFLPKVVVITIFPHLNDRQNAKVSISQSVIKQAKKSVVTPPAFDLSDLTVQSNVQTLAGENHNRNITTQPTILTTHQVTIHNIEERSINGTRNRMNIEIATKTTTL